MSNFGDHPAGFFGVSGFYNGVATTSYRNIPGQTLTRAYGATPSSTKIMSFGGWLKRDKTGFYSNVLSATLGGGGVAQGYIFISDGDVIAVQDLTQGGATTFSYITNRLFRDPSSWYHLWVRIDTTDSTAGDRVQLWVNGVRETSFSTATAPSENADTVALNQNKTHFFGHSNASYGGNVYLSDWYWLDGSSVSPVDTVGEFKGGVFIPKTYSGASFGNKGWHLKFDQVGVGSPSATTIGADSSGNDNHWTSTANTDVVANDCAMPDSPENNFCTLNPLESGKKFADSNQGLMTQSEGNLKFSGTRNVFGTIAVTSGKWYWEIINTSSTVNSVSVSGVVTHGSRAEHYAVYYNRNGNKGIGIMANGATESSYGATYTDDDIISVALNMDDNQVTFFKNNASQGTITDANLATGEVHAWTQNGNNSGTLVGVYNFGQDDTFAGEISSEGNTDGNGKGVFKYAPPSGFLALCSSNIPESTIGPNSSTQSDDYFNTVLYTGTGNNTQAITGVGFQPDWVWIKNRTDGYSHQLQDSNRGMVATKVLSTNQSKGEGVASATGDNYGHISAVGADGFTVTHTINSNNDGGTIRKGTHFANDTYVAWNWKANAGTTTTNDASATSVGATDSVFQANTDAGFSIVTYTGTGSATTFAHGLGGVPEVMIIKNRDAEHSWAGFYHHKMAGTAAASATDYLTFSGASTIVDDATIWNDTPPTSTVFTVGTASNTNSTDAFVGYFFRSIEGYSKFGSYSGNDAADGTFIFTGFSPAFVILKYASGSAGGTKNWTMYDNKRSPQNVNDNTLFVNTPAAEGADSAFDIDILSNGFKLRNAEGPVNNSAQYIYLAFAEAPFKYSNAR